MIYPPLQETNEAYHEALFGPDAQFTHGHPRGDLITALWLAGKVTTAELGREHLRLTEEDVASGVMPWDVYDFSELHNYVDANEYTLTVIGYDIETDDGLRLANEVQDWVSDALAGEQPSSIYFPDRWHLERQQRHRETTPGQYLAAVADANTPEAAR